MKITKKALSVLLAVIMILSSMNVCFGSIAFAAGKDVDVSKLAGLLENDTVKKANFTGTSGDYHISDPDGKILAATEEYFKVVDAMANKKPTVQTPSSGESDIKKTGDSSDTTYRTYNHLNTRVKTLLRDKMGDKYETYKVGAFITGLLAGAKIDAGTKEVLGTESETNNKTVPPTPLAAAPEIKLTVLMDTNVTAYDLDDLPGSIATEKVFKVTHANTNYDYHYDYTKATTDRKSVV